MGNFFSRVRSRKKPIAPLEARHRSAGVGHLIVIALRQGRKLLWNPLQELFTREGAKEGNERVAHDMRKPCDHSFIG